MAKIACFDVYYRESSALAACVLIETWTSLETAGEMVLQFESVTEYVPGEFYRRELPCLLALLKKVEAVYSELEALVIDGFVWLGDETRPGLGGHFYEALDRRLPVVGVAKSLMPSATPYREVLRGSSQRPLYISTAGTDLDAAARHIESMAGSYRMPFALKRVDAVSRTLEADSEARP